jgi:hypothetical protein
MAMKLTLNDMKVIKDLLATTYDQMKGDLATPAEISTVIIPLIKIDAMIEKEKAKLS